MWSKDLKDEYVECQEQMLVQSGEMPPESSSPARAGGHNGKPDDKVPRDGGNKKPEALSDDTGPEYAAGSWEPKPPKVLMDDPHARPLELRSQIQLYATNECVVSTFLGEKCV